MVYDKVVVQEIFLYPYSCKRNIVSVNTLQRPSGNDC